MRGISSKLTVSTYTQSQRAELERFYSDLSQEEDALSSLEEKFRIEELADKIDLTAEQVRMWLRNRKKRGVYKGRSALAVEQVRILEWIYENHSNYPSTNLKKRIAEELEISYSQLQVFFFFSFFILFFFQDYFFCLQINTHVPKKKRNGMKLGDKEVPLL